MKISSKLIHSMLFLAIIVYMPVTQAIEQSKRTLDITTNALDRSLDFTSDTTTSTRNKFKQIKAAKGDAAAYIASNGAIKGPYLVAALHILRDHNPAAKQATDLELAQAILAI